MAPVPLPGESHGQRSLADYSPWGCRESNKIEWLTLSFGLRGITRGKEPPAKAEEIKRRELDLWVGKIFWRRKWQPTPVFLPGESFGQRSLQVTFHSVAKSWTWLKQLSMHMKERKSHNLCDLQNLKYLFTNCC